MSTLEADVTEGTRAVQPGQPLATTALASFLPGPGTRPLQIAIGTSNPAKRRAVTMAFSQMFPSHTTEVHCFDVESGVQAQPMTGEETLRGSMNRAQRCRAAYTATHNSSIPDFAIGLEGGIERIADTFFESGFITVIGANGHIGRGTSARYEISQTMMAHLNDGVELGVVIDRLTGETSVRQSQGMMGIITNKVLPRDLCYSQGVIFALAPFVSHAMFWDNRAL